MTQGEARPLDVEGFVLAGGRGVRMGRDKALLEYGSCPMIVRAVENLRAVTPLPRIVGSRPDLARFASVVPDLHAGRGPLGGIHAALAATERDWNVFLPVDLPLLPAGFVRWMVSRAARTGALATVPVVAGLPQPLVAVYHRRLLPGLESALLGEDFKTIRAIAAAVSSVPWTAPAADFFSVETLVAVGAFSDILSDLPVSQWFQNVNTPSDANVSASYV